MRTILGPSTDRPKQKAVSSPQDGGRMHNRAVDPHDLLMGGIVSGVGSGGKAHIDEEIGKYLWGRCPLPGSS